ncbi:hypothetical protein E2C01_087476 [Portunus trituberculatus]|uniref:Uncharacterized protein n=1 Tax=Portunus trituberculatus TaxID=210409 RepID=A0A5B7JHD8_PORTR|nr:hypothetical protein [Portunus trituberculatus]
MIAQGNFLTYFAPNLPTPTTCSFPAPLYFPPLVTAVPSGTPSSYHIPRLLSLYRHPVRVSPVSFPLPLLPSHHAHTPYCRLPPRPAPRQRFNIAIPALQNGF